MSSFSVKEFYSQALRLYTNLYQTEEIINIISQYIFFYPYHIHCSHVLNEHLDSVSSISLCNNGLLASGSYDHTIKVWDIAKKKCIHTLFDLNDRITCVKPIKNCHIVCGSQDNKIRIWNIETGKCEQTLSEHQDYVTCIVILSSNEFVSGSKDRLLKIWQEKIVNEDLNPAFEYIATCKGHEDVINCLEVISHTVVASGSEDLTIRIWNIKTYECLNIISINGTITSLLHFNNSLAVGSWFYIYIYDLSTYSCQTMLKGHQGFVLSLSHQDQYLYSGGLDNSIRVWDLNVPIAEYPLQILSEHLQAVNCLCQNDNSVLVSGSQDHTIRIWVRDN